MALEPNRRHTGKLHPASPEITLPSCHRFLALMATVRLKANHSFLERSMGKSTSRVTRPLSTGASRNPPQYTLQKAGRQIWLGCKSERGFANILARLCGWWVGSHTHLVTLLCSAPSSNDAICTNTGLSAALQQETMQGGWVVKRKWRLNRTGPRMERFIQLCWRSPSHGRLNKIHVSACVYMFVHTCAIVFHTRPISS